ncbi:MAG: hypothetical protein K6C35_00085 [Eubacterium sp.]|nr:hypothetical protein [Eubacterium sp.]
MLKTMKYEIIRNKMTLFILGSVIGAAELVFLFGLITDKRSTIGLGIALLVFGTSIVYFSIWLLGIMSFSHDLRDKTGYMVFLTPISPYKIIFSKILVGLFELILAAVLFIILASIDIKILLDKFGASAEVFDAIARILGSSKSTIWAAFIVFVLGLVFSVLLYYSVAYFMSAVSALLARGKGAQRFISIVLVIVFIIIYNVIDRKLPTIDNNISNEAFRLFVKNIPSYLVALCVSAGFTFGCGYLMDNKLSL